MNGARRTRLSKFCSGALRHFPDDAGIDLDGAGWTEWGALIAAVEAKYDWASADDVAAVVATDPKGRFELDERGGVRLIRAAYGHSVEVDLNAEATPVPETLYHGTAPRNVEAIQSAGLQPMGRQQVHLSESVDAAREVGARHADDPVIFAVDATTMTADGHLIIKRGRATYTTDRVPSNYLRRLD
jgi:putative RNA 2'-phosphotransferase